LMLLFQLVGAPAQLKPEPLGHPPGTVEPEAAVPPRSDAPQQHIGDGDRRLLARGEHDLAEQIRAVWAERSQQLRLRLHDPRQGTQSRAVQRAQMIAGYRSDLVQEPARRISFSRT